MKLGLLPLSLLRMNVCLPSIVCEARMQWTGKGARDRYSGQQGKGEALERESMKGTGNDTERANQTRCTCDLAQGLSFRRPRLGFQDPQSLGLALQLC